MTTILVVVKDSNELIDILIVIENIYFIYKS